MRTVIFILLSFAGFYSNAQSFTMQLSTDSILLGNVIQLQYKIEDSNGEFEAPQFENIQIVSGPNLSSSMQIINGQTSSKKQISYILRPTELGSIYIPPAYLLTEEYTLETEPMEIHVYPNPEGIIENPVMENSFIFESFEWPQFQFRNEIPDPLKPGQQMPKSKSKQKIRRL